MTTKLTTDKTLTFEALKALNGEGYDPADIRTYKCPAICANPRKEVQAHLALSGYGSTTRSSYTTRIGSFLGHSSVEFIKKVSNMVLHFPKASDFNQLKPIKSLELPSLYPSWMIERYELDDCVTLQHLTPVFYDARQHKFVAFLDTDFYRDLSPASVKFGNIPNYHTMQDKNGKPYGAFTADTFKELTNSVISTKTGEDSSFQQVVKVYRRHFLSASNGERVVCVGFKHKASTKSSHELLTDVHSYSHSDLVSKLTRFQSVAFELYQGALVDDMVYLMDDDGTLHPDAMVLATKQRRKRAEGDKFLQGTTKDFTYFTIPYTDHDWQKLVAIHERVNSIMTELQSFFLSGTLPNEKHDKPLSELKATPAFLGLTNEQ